jgi:O-antigen biosynthesis protein
MSVADPALAARVEAWIDSAGHSADEVVRMTQAVLDAGFDPKGVRIVVDAIAHEDTPEMIRGAESIAIETVSADAVALEQQLSQTTAEFLVIVRRGLVVPELLPKAVGFLDRFPSVEITYGDSVTVAGAPLLRPLFSPTITSARWSSRASRRCAPSAGSEPRRGARRSSTSRFGHPPRGVPSRSSRWCWLPKT